MYILPPRSGRKKSVRTKTSYELWLDRKALVSENHKLSMRMAVQIKKPVSMCLNSSMSTAIKFEYFPLSKYDSLIKTAGTAKQRKRNTKPVDSIFLEIETFHWHPCNL